MRIIELETVTKTIQITQQEAKWQLVSIKGTNPVSGTHNTSAIVGGNGSIINSTRINDRQIVLTLAINTPVERHRLELYNALLVNDNVRLRYKTDLIDVYIDGIIQSNECDMNSDLVLMPIVINCPYPFFKSAKNIATDTSKYEDHLEFKNGYLEIIEDIAFSTVEFNDRVIINNTSQIEVGMIITFKPLSDISNVIIHRGDEHFGITGDFKGGDEIIINTNFGEESVYLIRGSEVINILNNIMSDNTWIQMKKGTNEFTYSGSGSNFMDVSISYINEYQGV